VKQERHAALARGRRAEALAAWRLRLAGWRILARNLKLPQGEIDIVARRGGVVAFVEVKTRAEVAIAVEAVTARQRRRIRNAAAGFLALRPDLAGLVLRFDAVLVVGAWPRHVPDAWRHDGRDDG
jgi:putative endonuclease